MDTLRADNKKTTFSVFYPLIMCDLEYQLLFVHIYNGNLKYQEILWNQSLLLIWYLELCSTYSEGIVQIEKRAYQSLN